MTPEEVAALQEQMEQVERKLNPVQNKLSRFRKAQVEAGELIEQHFNRVAGEEKRLEGLKKAREARTAKNEERKVKAQTRRRLNKKASGKESHVEEFINE